MARYGIIAVYRNKTSGNYIIQPMSRHPTGAVADFGEPTAMSEGDFDSGIASAVLENLDKFDRKTFKREEAPRFSNEEYARFTRTHDRVTITRQDNGTLEASPSRRVRVGYEHDVPARLASVLRDAFKRCG